MFAHTKMASHIERKLSEHDFFLLILIYYIWMSSHSSEALTFIEYNQFHSRFPYYNHHQLQPQPPSLFGSSRRLTSTKNQTLPLPIQIRILLPPSWLHLVRSPAATRLPHRLGRIILMVLLLGTIVPPPSPCNHHLQAPRRPIPLQRRRKKRMIGMNRI